MRILLIALAFSLALSSGAQDSTYAEKLGFPKGAKVLVIHVDDCGMSLDQNNGSIDAMTKGVASSTSIMMPCPWVPGIFHYIKDHPDFDAGLHLTLTSEWDNYRWGPVAGPSKVPGLMDPEGAMWQEVEQVVAHATADEIDTEIRAQMERCLKFGFRPTHIDSHMGTLFARPDYLERYLKLGMEYHVPVMFPGGHNTLITAQMKALHVDMESTRRIGKSLWDAGLPVIDDLLNESYANQLPAGFDPTPANLEKFATAFYMDAVKRMKPGITYVITHCIRRTEVFNAISGSGNIRQGDYLAMMNPAFRKFLQDNGVIVTTMRELMERRKKRA
jgi:chitin disaccharide deacetylase